MITAYIFVLPSFIGFLLFVLYPLLNAGFLSFMNQNLFTMEMKFIGLKNYIKIFSDYRSVAILRNTLWYACFCTIGNTLIGLCLAIALNDKLSSIMTMVFRAIYFFPSLVGLVFVAIIWQYILQKDTGILNYYLNGLNINSIGWLSDPRFSRISVLFLDVWKNLGMSMLLILVGLQHIGDEYYEAARIEGAVSFTVFFKITLPLVSPTLFFVFITNLTGALRIFESVQVLTAGGPGDSSRSLAMFIWEKGFKSYDYGGATALSILLLLLIILITVIQFAGSKRWVYYD
jgi:multiple sugar transport system permease protein